jgi:glycerol-3-phosphate acyltransferase PlsY
MLVFLVLAAYLLGSVPFGFIIARIWNIDIRQHGSGNIGATNILRTLGPVPAGLVFILDFLKGTLAVYIGYWVGGDPLVVLLLGVAVIFGHMFPVFLGFKGGKGAATGLGVLAALAPEVFLVSMLLVAVIIVATRYVSLASIIVPFVAAALMLILKKPLPYAAATLFVAIIILIRHIPNLKRLRKGTEPRI